MLKKLVKKFSKSHPFKKFLSSSKGINLKKQIAACNLDELLNCEKISNIEFDKFSLLLIAGEISKRRFAEPYWTQYVAADYLLCDKLIQMETGEGKTLAIAMAAFVSAKMNRKTFVVSSNDYLAERDAKFFNQIFDGSGVKAAFNAHGDLNSKLAIFSEPVIYTSPTELAFDYLRSNMTSSSDGVYFPKEYFQTVFVDEADSILLDMATKDHILSMKDEVDKSIPFVQLADKFFREVPLEKVEIKNRGKTQDTLLGMMNASKEEVLLFQEEQQTKLTDSVDLEESESPDFSVDYENQLVLLEEGIYDKMDNWASNELNSEAGKFHESKDFISFVAAVKNRLIAEFILKKDVHYSINSDGEAIPFDLNTGRLMAKSRFSDGIHQAIEVKEGLIIRPDSKAKDGISYQAFFCLFQNLSGLSGTIFHSKEEFLKTYKRNSVLIEPYKEKQRIDHPTRFFFDKESKNNHILAFAKEKNQTGQPILISCPDEKETENLFNCFTKAGLKVQYLASSTLSQEAEIISKAGKKGQITIATDMAGRGTDILIDEDVERIGGLCVICSEYRANKRSELQIKGRSGRQGQKGETHTFASYGDDLLIRYVTPKQRNFLANFFLKFSLYGNKEAWVYSSLINGRVANVFENVQRNTENLYAEYRFQLKKRGAHLQKQREANYSYREYIRNMNAEEMQSYLSSCFVDYVFAEMNNVFNGVLSFEEMKKNLLGLVKNETLKSSIETLIEEKLKYLEVQESACPEISDVGEKIFKANLLPLIRLGEMDLIHDRLKSTIITLLLDVWASHVDYCCDLNSTINLSPGINHKQTYETLSEKKFIEAHNPCEGLNIVSSVANIDWLQSYLSGDDSFFAKESREIFYKEAESVPGFASAIA